VIIMASSAAPQPTHVQYFKGLQLNCEGALKAVKSETTIQNAKQSLFKSLMIGLGLNAVMLLFAFPIVLLSKALASITGYDMALSFYQSLLVCVRFSMWFVPTIGLLLIRNLHGSKAFLRTLKELDPEFAEKLAKAEGEPLCKSLRETVVRVMKQVLILLTVFLLSYIPYVGGIVTSLALYYRMARPHWKEVQLANAVFLVLSFAAPVSWAQFVLTLQSCTLCLSYELLSPYIAKRRSMKEGDGKDVVTQYTPLIMAFSAPWVILLSVPVFGLAAWEFMEYAAAFLLVKLVNDDV